jgi:hypothetical protein
MSGNPSTRITNFDVRALTIFDQEEGTLQLQSTNKFSVILDSAQNQLTMYWEGGTRQEWTEFKHQIGLVVIQYEANNGPVA